jgi:alanyl aminopeptidase
VQLAQAETVPGGQLPDTIVPEHYALHLKVAPAKPRFEGVATINVKVSEALKHFYLHGQDLDVKSVEVLTADGRALAAKATETSEVGVLKISLDTELTAGSHRLIFHYDAPFNGNLQGLYRVKDGEAWYAFTQMESIYARYAFPSFDEPRFKTTFDLTLEVPSELTAIANTPETKTLKLANGWKRVSSMTSKPMPTYLWAIAVGECDVVSWDDIPATELRDFAIPFRGIATKGKGDKLEYALKNTQAIMESLEDYFQIPYPYRKLDILAVPDFAAGAMENIGAITYREQLLLLDEESSIAQKRSYKSVHAHELAHQWFGNLVTPVWWNDIWLNEAFATWMAATALERRFPGEQWARQQIGRSKWAMQQDSIPSARKVRNPINSNGDIITAFDGITYSKGGGVLSMMEHYMGAERFRKGVQMFMQQYAWGNADAINFFEAVASAMPEKERAATLAAFRNFVEQAGVPQLRISESCKDEKTVLTIAQSRYAPLGTKYEEDFKWNIPFCARYMAGGELQTQCQILNDAKSEVTLEATQCADWVMPNARAAGYYRFALDNKEWRKLLENMSALDAPEANAVMDSMQAAFDIGELSVDDMLALIPATLAADSWELAVSGTKVLNKLMLHAKAQQKPALRALAADIYRDKVEALGLGSDTELDKKNALDASEMRRRLVYFQAMMSEEPALRKALAEKAAAYVGYKKDGKLHDEALQPALRGTAMAVAAQDYGVEFVELLNKHLNEANDGTLRMRLLFAIASSKDETQAKATMARIQSEELRDNEKIQLLYVLADIEELDAVFWPWFKNNFEQLVQDLPVGFHSRMPYLLSDSCREGAAQRLESLIKPRLKDLMGAETNYDKAQEFLQQCYAQREKLRPQIDKLLDK